MYLQQISIKDILYHYYKFICTYLTLRKIANGNFPEQMAIFRRVRYIHVYTDINIVKSSSFLRLVGLCLLQNEICPMFMNRHVLKCVLGRRLGWHDLAFFDPVMYESLRSLVEDAEGKDPQVIHSLDLQFCVELCAEEVRTI